MILPSPWASAVIVVLFATSSTTRSIVLCEDVKNTLNIPVPLGSDKVIDLDVTRIACPPNGEDDQMEEIVVSGGTLILRSDSTVRFVNLRFTVQDGGSLVFDMPKTQFGPNSGYSENAPDYMLRVKKGSTAVFKGDFGGRKVESFRSMFYNAGTMEFEGKSLFQDNGNVFRSNSGVLKFREEAVFRDNIYLAIDNIDDGFVRFSKEAIFDRNGLAFDGGLGCAIGNKEPEGSVSFRGKAYFTNHRLGCVKGGAVFNAGTMRFYDKAFFEANGADIDGGAVYNLLGRMVFTAAVQFHDNEANRYGGGIAVRGGEVTFRRSVLFDSNLAGVEGGGFSVQKGNIVEDGVVVVDDPFIDFQKVVYSRNNGITGPDKDVCVLGHLGSEGGVSFPAGNFCSGELSDDVFRRNV